MIRISRVIVAITYVCLIWSSVLGVELTTRSLRDGSPGAAIGHHDIIRSLQGSSVEAAAAGGSNGDALIKNNAECHDNNCTTATATATALDKKNGSSGRLETTLSGGNGSYGNMFDVRALVDVEVTRVEFYTDLQKVVDYEVYSRVGSYVGSELSRTNWTSISNSSVMGQGLGQPTFTDIFATPLFVPAGTLRSFYVTLTKPDIRYTLGDREHTIFVSNRHLEILEGIGVAGYPFGPFFFRPRIFNGAVHYNYDLLPNSSSPPDNESTLPSYPQSSPVTITPSPTLAAKRTTQVVYKFLIQHRLSLSTELVPSIVDTKLATVFNSMFVDHTKQLQEMSREHGLELVLVQSIIGGQNSHGSWCIPVDDTSICSAVNSAIQVHHFDTISEKEVRYALLLYAPDFISMELMREFVSVQYIGARAVHTTIILTMYADSIEMAPEDDLPYFERLTGEFLDDTLQAASSPLSIARVKLNGQKLRNTKSTSSYADKKNYNSGGGDGLRDYSSSPKVSKVPSSPTSTYQYGGGNNRNLYDENSFDDDTIIPGAKPRMRLKKNHGVDHTIAGIDADTTAHYDQTIPPESSSIDLSLIITGEYLPPPDIDLDAEVQESFDNNAEDFMTHVAQAIPAFENVTRIVASGFMNQPEVDLKGGGADLDKDLILPPKQDDSTEDVGHGDNIETGFMSSTFSLVVFGALGVVIILIVSITVVGLFQKKKIQARRTSENRYDQDNIYDIAEEEEYCDDDADDNTFVSIVSHDLPNQNVSKNKKFTDVWGRS